MRGRGSRRPGRERFIGLMSGTSADGVEAALVSVAAAGGGSPSVRLVAHRSFPFPKALRARVLRASELPAPPEGAGGVGGTPAGQSTAELAVLHYELGKRFAAAAVGVAEGAGVDLSRVTAVGSHGQTVCHRPPRNPTAGRSRAVDATLQIGEAALIAERTGVTTVADFRPADVAAGGLGAPLTPYAHGVLFARADRPVLVVNLGGIANVTWIPPGFRADAPGDRNGLRGFDAGPANILLDAAAIEFSRGKRGYDRGGRAAARGEVDEDLLRRLMRHPFLRRRPPKATGREDFGGAFLETAAGAKTMRFGSKRFCDFMATLAAFTTRSVGKQVKRFLGPVGEVVVCGGGAHNPVLMDGLRAEFPAADVVRSDARGIPARAVEAVSFALLARAALLGVPANVPGITGARRPVILGKILPTG